MQCNALHFSYQPFSAGCSCRDANIQQGVLAALARQPLDSIVESSCTVPDTAHWLHMAAMSGREAACRDAASIVKAVLGKQQPQLQQRLLMAYAHAVEVLHQEPKTRGASQLMASAVDSIALAFLPQLQQSAISEQ
jgi:hypothetical protein